MIFIFRVSASVFVLLASLLRFLTARCAVTIAIAGVAAAVKMRKPKTSQPMMFEEPPTDTVPVEEELPLPPDY
jgi:hypothetical protein